MSISIEWIFYTSFLAFVALLAAAALGYLALESIALSAVDVDGLDFAVDPDLNGRGSTRTLSKLSSMLNSKVPGQNGDVPIST